MLVKIIFHNTFCMNCELSVEKHLWSVIFLAFPKCFYFFYISRSATEKRLYMDTCRTYIIYFCLGSFTTKTKKVISENGNEGPNQLARKRRHKMPNACLQQTGSQCWHIIASAGPLIRRDCVTFHLRVNIANNGSWITNILYRNHAGSGTTGWQMHKAILCFFLDETTFQLETPFNTVSLWISTINCSPC